MMLLGLKSLDSDINCSATNANDTGGVAPAAIISVLPDATDAVSGDLLIKQYPDGVTIGKYYYAYEVLGGGKCKANVNAIHAAFGLAVKDTKKAN
jgi:hypothetical protein